MSDMNTTEIRQEVRFYKRPLNAVEERIANQLYDALDEIDRLIKEAHTAAEQYRKLEDELKACREATHHCPVCGMRFAYEGKSDVKMEIDNP
jgi:hypothetical protein